MKNPFHYDNHSPWNAESAYTCSLPLGAALPQAPLSETWFLNSPDSEQQLIGPEMAPAPSLAKNSPLWDFWNRNPELQCWSLLEADVKLRTKDFSYHVSHPGKILIYGESKWRYNMEKSRSLLNLHPRAPKAQLHACYSWMVVVKDYSLILVS